MATPRSPPLLNPFRFLGVDPVQVSSYRGPPTDRPPDRPFRGRSVYGRCSLERASTQCPVYHLASFLSLAHSLSGNVTPLQKLQFSVWTPSDCQVPSQVGSSHEFNRVLSWMHPRCGHFRSKRVPSQRHVPTPDSAAFNGTAGPSYPSFRGLSCTTGVPGLRAVVQCSPAPRWGQTK
jgi:hypothetical protein